MKFEKLGNIADIIAGQSPPSSTYNSEGKGIPFFQGKADYGEKFPSVRYWCTEPTKISLPDDILISMRAPVGPVNINIVESCIGRGLSAIRVRKNVSRDFIFFWLKQNQHIIAAKETGSTFKAITQKILSEIIVPFPDYSDQLHIASILSKAENLIAQRKESIRLLDEFLKSTFLEMFGDIKGEKVPLTSACILNPKKSEISGIVRTTEVSFIPMANVSEKGEVNLSQTRTLESVWNGFTFFKENDVVFAKITPCMENGKGAIMKNLKNKIGFGTTEFHVLRPIEGISTSAWLYHLTTQDSFRKKAEQNMTGSAGQKRVPADYFEHYKVVIPPIELQTQFARIVEKTEALKSQYQQSLTELENLYGSLSQKAFKGELTLKNHANP
jgi:type I restriction enzyme S subunit